MELGDYDDVHALARAVGDEYLKSVLLRAALGEFSARSWHIGIIAWNWQVFVRSCLYHKGSSR
jgi:hypothetical protein